MRFIHVRPERLRRYWPAIAARLAPAVRQDAGQTIQGVYERLMGGPDVLLRVSGEAHGFIVIEVTEGRALWTKYVGGKVHGGPKRRARVMRTMARHIEDMARQAGCIEHRICGRDWSFLLPEYEPFEGQTNGLRKGL